MKLFVDLIRPAGAQRLAVFLHGILGSGQNLRTVARRFTERCPGWAAAVVDLRGHGRSLALDERPATIDTVAADLLETLAGGELPVAAIIGHSFGGKVAIEVARRAPAPGPLAHLVVMDSLPGARPDHRGSEAIDEVLRALDAAPGPFASREAFVAAIHAQGPSVPIAQWLATSVKRDEHGAFRFALDLTFIRAVLADYFARDLWSVIDAPPQGLSVHLILGGSSPVFGADDRARAEALAARAVITIDVLPTGHWVHAEDPDGVVRALSERLGERGSTDGATDGTVAS